MYDLKVRDSPRDILMLPLIRPVPEALIALARTVRNPNIPLTASDDTFGLSLLFHTKLYTSTPYCVGATERCGYAVTSIKLITLSSRADAQAICVSHSSEIRATSDPRTDWSGLNVLHVSTLIPRYCSTFGVSDCQTKTLFRTWPSLFVSASSRQTGYTEYHRHPLPQSFHLCTRQMQ